MRIALIVPGGVERSGTERVIPALLWLIERLAQRHEMHVFALEQYPQPCSYRLLGAMVHNLGTPVWLPRLRMAYWWPALVNRLRAYGPFDVLHAFWAAPTGLLAATAGRILQIPSIVSLAGGELVALPDIDYGSQVRRLDRQKVAATLRLATTTTVSSRYMAILAHGHGIRPQVVPLGVPAASCSTGQPVAAGPPWRLLHVASLNRVKDQPTLLRAFDLVRAREPGIALDIIGADTLQGEIQAMAHAMGLAGHITFHGFLPSERVRRFFQQAHLLVLPSRHDAAPVVMLEAAACAVPTVGTAVGYAADWAPKRALAVPVGDAGALATGILALLRDDRRRIDMGQAAYCWARAYDADWTAAQFQALYYRFVEPTASR